RKADGRVFGCDACQEACPWNRRAPAGKLVALRARPEQRALSLVETLGLTHEEARARFTGTPLLRAGRDGLVRSALAVAKRPLAPEVRELARKLLEDPAEGVRVEARRALSATEG
ncbi:MAG TPA: tRNA epoxyqueuosine(34) reductase QueG, partial [Myxococcales bacterium]|nr:tRNA epoxyqueuosine(34) reductase QueG [Myxococcales bacterium]